MHDIQASSLSVLPGVWQPVPTLQRMCDDDICARYELVAVEQLVRQVQKQGVRPVVVEQHDCVHRVEALWQDREPRA